jgi:hypothetical protein
MAKSREQRIGSGQIGERRRGIASIENSPWLSQRYGWFIDLLILVRERVQRFGHRIKR